jgi:hypothetical protein
LEVTVKIFNATSFRRLIPASAVAAALAFAYMAPLPVDASKINNCGVKGGYAYGGYAFAFHDHGKLCPNRPFPGKGNGVAKFLITGSTPAITTTATTSSSSDVNTASVGGSSTSPVGGGSSTSPVGADTQAAGKSHAHGKGHGRGKDSKG